MRLADARSDHDLESDPSVDKRRVVIAGIAESPIVVGARTIELVVKRVRHTDTRVEPRIKGWSPVTPG